ncbi:hypothetical protein HY967_03290 [Candidatus Jorgensenbacteria bacterium]|nr:hypothetical protein [Candidatus Jorgensenbacteria bacterium]
MLTTLDEGKKRIYMVLGIVVVAFILWKALVVVGVLPSSDFPAVAGASWQSVFLTNNQVYFGHLKNYNREYVVLNDIFYLRVAEALQQGSSQQPPSLNLVKLGGELHGPQDMMYIPKDKIMFWENLKDDSQVVQAINNFIGQSK